MNTKNVCLGLGLGLVIAACTSEVPLGSGSAALGGEGEPPRGDGTCDPLLTNCGSVCSRACVSTDGGASDGGRDGSRSDGSTPDSGGGDGAVSNDARVDANATQYLLRVSFSGYGNSMGTNIHDWLDDTSPGGGVGSCGGGTWSSTSMKGFKVVTGHTYNYNYWIDTSSFTFCSAGPIPPYYTQMIGPITGDTNIVVTPNDPFTH